jgi:hypothetical protein
VADSRVEAVLKLGSRRSLVDSDALNLQRLATEERTGAEIYVPSGSRFVCVRGRLRRVYVALDGKLK